MSDVLNSVPFGDRLVRPPYAELALEGLVPAERYKPTEAMHCRVAVADVFSDKDARIDQLLFGEIFDVLDTEAGRAFGRSRRDGVVGWVGLDYLAAGAPRPSRRVTSVDAVLPLNALVSGGEGVSDEETGPIGEFAEDLAEVAERLLGRPHAPGARSSIETDCSGLVQQALFACGLPGPRHAGDQAELGHAVTGAPERGDIVVWLAPREHASDWSGHAALMLDDSRIIHSTADKGGVVIETLAEVEARLVAEGYAGARFRRL